MQKLIFLDLDGTLTPHSTWYELNTLLGITPEEDKHLFEQYLDQQHTYQAWIEALVALYRARTPISKEAIEDMSRSLPLRPGAEELITQLKEQGYTVVLISGSVDTIVKTIASRLQIDTWIACTKVVYDDQDIVTDLVSSGDEAFAKDTFAKAYCVEHGYDLSRAYVVGDGGNEIELFRTAKGILLGTNEKLQPLAWKQVSTLAEIPALLP